MAISVFTNVPGLNAQRNLSASAAGMSRSLRRLSSGMRINSAADDAAGMAISNGLDSQVRGLNQAIRNAGDGLSLLDTTDGALVEQTGILQRLREIAVQSAADTNNQGNRNDLNNEAANLKNELERIARTTTFNGNNLLDGSFQGKDIQVGSNSTGDDRIQISLASSKTADLGGIDVPTLGSTTHTVEGATYTANRWNTPVAGDVNLTVGGTTYNVGATTADGISATNPDFPNMNRYSARSWANAINAISGLTGVTADYAYTFTDDLYTPQAATFANGDLRINGVNIGPVTLTGPTDTALVDAINAKQALTGVTAALNASNEMVYTVADGRGLYIDPNDSVHFALGFIHLSRTAPGDITLHSASAFTVGGNNPDRAGLVPGAATPSTPSTIVHENVGTIDLSSKQGAQLAIQIADRALGQLNSRRAQIGALNNRLNSAIANLSSSSENATAAYSRIMDADFARGNGDDVEIADPAASRHFDSVASQSSSATRRVAAALNRWPTLPQETDAPALDAGGFFLIFFLINL